MTLTGEERTGLEAMISKGKADARKLAYARVLIQADEVDGAPARTDQEIASPLNLSTPHRRAASGSSSSRRAFEAAPRPRPTKC